MAEIDEGYDQAQASTDEDGRLRAVHPSIRPCGQRTKIWARTVHLMDKFGRWTKIFFKVDEWTDFLYRGPSTSWSMSHGRIRTIDHDNLWQVEGRTDGPSTS